jgi:parvulin-like peptidyl-prolyl isomerase
MKSFFRIKRFSKGLFPFALSGVLTAFLIFFINHSQAVLIDRIVASVNGEVITLYDLYKAEKPVFGKVIVSDENHIKDPEDAARERLLLDKIIEERLIVQRADELGISVSTEEVEAAVKTIMDREMLNEEMFQNALEKGGMNLEEYHERIRSQLLVSKVFNNQIRMKTVVSPEDIEEYYQEHAAEYRTPERIKMRHILVIRNEGEEEEEARARAEKILSLLEPGSDFQEVAREYSEDSSRHKGEISGYIQRGDTLPELEKVLFAMEEGEISPPVKTELGFHILKLENKDPARTRSLQEMTPEIIDLLTEEKTKNRYDDWLMEIKKEASIDVRL